MSLVLMPKGVKGQGGVLVAERVCLCELTRGFHPTDHPPGA